MKTLPIITLLLVLWNLSTAQEIKRVHEVGLGLAGFDDFTMVYRIGNEKALWRLQTLFSRGYRSADMVRDSMVDENQYHSVGIAIGRECRKNIVDQLDFRFGSDVGFNYAKSRMKVDDISILNGDEEYWSQSFNPRIHLVLGFVYSIQEKLVIGIEVLPSFGVNYNKRYDDDGYGEPTEFSDVGFSYSVNKDVIWLSVAYRFPKRTKD